MEVNYDLTLEDFQAFNQFHAKHPGQARLRRNPRTPWWVWLLLIGIVLVLFVSGSVHDDMWDEFLWTFRLCVGVFCLSVVFLFLIWVLWSRRLQVQVLKQHFDVLQRSGRTSGLYLALTPESLVANTPVSTSTTRWEGIDRVEATDTHAFLYTGPTIAHVVPRRAFASDADFRAFVDLAQSYQEGAIPVAEAAGPTPHGTPQSAGPQEGITATPARQRVSPPGPLGGPPRSRPPSPP